MGRRPHSRRPLSGVASGNALSLSLHTPVSPLFLVLPCPHAAAVLYAYAAPHDLKTAVHVSRQRTITTSYTLCTKTSHALMAVRLFAGYARYADRSPLFAALSRPVHLSTSPESNKHENLYRVSSRPVTSLIPSSNGVALAVSPAANPPLHRQQSLHWPPLRMICWGASCVSMVRSPRISSHVNISGRLLSPHPASHPTRLPFVLLPFSLVSPIFHVSIVIHIFAVSTLFRRPLGLALALPCVFLGLSLTLCNPPRTRYINNRLNSIARGLIGTGVFRD